METEPEHEAHGGMRSHPSRVQTRGFLFADLRGYTEYVDRRGDLAAARLLSRYRAIVRQAVAEFDGAEIRTEGDGFYVVFPSASSAVGCALAIVHGATTARADAPDDPIRVAIGIHAGETAETGDDYVGSAINTAARIAATARAGEVLVSDTVRALTRTLLPVSFVSRGSPRLKGLAEPVHVYEVLQLTGDADRRELRRPGRRRAPRTAVALIALGAAAVVSIVVVIAALLVRTPGPVSTSGPLGGTSAITTDRPTMPAGAGTSAGSLGGLSMAERALHDRVPGSIRDRCAADSQLSSGADARLRCDLALGAAADTVWYEHHETRALLDVTLSAIVRDEGLEAGDCAAVAKASDSWSTILGTYSGRRLCYQRDGSSWLWWSYDDQLILAGATRRDLDSAALFAWWESIGPFLRSP